MIEKYTKSFFILLLILFLSSCSDNITGFKKAELNQEFELKVNEQAHIKNTNLSITFNQVTEDNRCPILADCLTVGNAAIQLNLQNSLSISFDTLNTDVGSKNIRFINYEIKLIKLAPERIDAKKIEEKYYVATLEVETLL